MPHPARIAVVLLIVAPLLAAPASGVVLDFEGLPASTITGGTQAPDPASVITDQFRADGVVFGHAGVSTGVAVVQGISTAPSSGVNSVAGLDQNGMMPGSASGAITGDIYFRLVVPGTDTPATSDDIRFTIGDGGGDVDQFILRAYDVAGNLLMADPKAGASRFAVTLAMPGMNRVEIDFLGDAGYTLDDLELVVGPPKGCDLRTASLWELVPPIDEATLLFTDDVSCPPQLMPPDVLVTDFSMAPDQDLPDLLLGGPPLIVYNVMCPCTGLLFMSKSGDYVHATFR